MPILNLSKNKKEDSESKEGGDGKEEVPDELPSLPQDKKEEEKKDDSSEEKPEEKKEGAAAEGDAAPAEGKTEDAPASDAKADPPSDGDGDDSSAAEKKEEPAPDELPPVAEEAKPAAEKKQEPSAPEPEKQKVLDERLYLSKLIKKINEGTSIEDIEKEFSSKGIIAHLKENSNHNTSEDIKDTVEKDITSMMADLASLEKQWISLKKEIEEKQALFTDTEKKIKGQADAIKKKFSEIDEIKKKF